MLKKLRHNLYFRINELCFCITKNHWKWFVSFKTLIWECSSKCQLLQPFKFKWHFSKKQPLTVQSKHNQHFANAWVLHGSPCPRFIFYNLAVTFLENVLLAKSYPTSIFLFKCSNNAAQPCSCVHCLKSENSIFSCVIKSVVAVRAHLCFQCENKRRGTPSSHTV